MRSSYIRMNAQAELRDNLRTAIKEAGLTQAAAATDAGVNYTHLVGFLSGNNWLTRDAAESLAEALDMSLDEILGGSIFKDDPRARTKEFDFTPQKWKEFWESQSLADSIVEPEEGRARAICCECGTLRTTAAVEYVEWMDHPEVVAEGRPKMLKTLVCAACGQQTRHAVLRIDKGRDAIEAIQNAPTNGELARQQLRSLIDRVAGFNVDVHFRQRRKKQRAKGYAVYSEFDESKGRWRVEIDPNLPAEIQLRLLEDQWRRISTDDWGDIDWDPKDGTICAPSQGAWDDAVNLLIEDFDRFLAVERRWMVTEINDEITEVDSSGDQVEGGGAA